ncbi:MAG: hypothetical protein OCD01_09885 [Fibrobacterales bacterium]
MNNTFNKYLPIVSFSVILLFISSCFNSTGSGDINELSESSSVGLISSSSMNDQANHSSILNVSSADEGIPSSSSVVATPQSSSEHIDLSSSYKETIQASSAYAYQGTTITNNVVTSYNDSLIVYQNTKMECNLNNEWVLHNDYAVNRQFTLSGDSLYWSRGCVYDLFIGNSSTIIGTWEFVEKKQFVNAPYYCDNNPLPVMNIKKTLTMVITPNEVIETETLEYNCIVEDLLQPWFAFDTSFTVTDCFSYSRVSDGVKSTSSLGPESSFTRYEYNNHTCSEVPAPINQADPSDCSTGAQTRTEFKDCYTSLLTELCTAENYNSLNECSFFCYDYPDEEFCIN